MGDQISICEVSPRDGLPILCKSASVEEKRMYIDALIWAGIRKIECVAFTHPRLMPEHADAEKIMSGLKKKSDVSYFGLVPNEIGCRRALRAGIDGVVTLVAATDIYTRVNAGKNLREHCQKILPAIFNVANQNGISVRSHILAAFGCPYTGKVPIEEVIQLAMKLTFMGAKEIVLSDTTGVADPLQVKELVRSLLALNLESKLAAHFHNTRGTAMLNCYAAYEAGVRIFDASLSGMSVTPYGSMEHASGYWNIPTEDLVHLFEKIGVKTGIDLDRLLECAAIGERLAKRVLPGHILRAKKYTELVKVPIKPMTAEMSSGE